ncbi:MAG: bifunctional diaminohydroxyphosphoribosylaminopyrimidine deaminase/5-amino-6-(5-phosphoribosylamino)uracil reductase RibD [Lachnospiraceae bacterium]|jgi:diaminohydroxyphosphoribosylaminopyrimidine deaminase/5-amino-6-(5-phosphoribosylamino)uracil reductase|nr:bifunctional diaminohydroxyphosphoribosylaminopyrimidine deaminase/5-amino-6-(5-phosphoribosylamino)uracil reductase RibD [Lachnospiraceae bacterium]
MIPEERYMRRAIELARQGEGKVNPNPLVGCVVVKEGQIIAEGFHESYGGFHAERNALLSCGEEARGADLYVNLEPCCHYGKTPPCVEMILEKGIRRVFLGCQDPNPLVAGKGTALLREKGVQVTEGILEKECRELNEIFFHYIRTGRPFTAMKYAMTLDGRIAADGGSSKWITGEAARRHVHTLRRRYSAILAGIGTALADDPMLDCRIQEGVNPVRILCDSHLRLPLESKIVRTAGQIPTILACLQEDRSQEKAEKLIEAGVKVWQISGSQRGPKERVDLKHLWKKIGEAGIDSILVEGGGILHGSLLTEGLVDRVYAYIAPKLISGETNQGPVRGTGILRMAQAVTLKDSRILSLEEDYLIIGTVAHKLERD